MQFNLQMNYFFEVKKLLAYLRDYVILLTIIDVIDL